MLLWWHGYVEDKEWVWSRKCLLSPEHSLLLNIPIFFHCTICFCAFLISNFSSCWHRCTDILFSIQDTISGGWFNWSDKIITWKRLRLLPYPRGYMQSSLMRERTCWFHISPLQTVLWTWWNIWLIQLITRSSCSPRQTHFIPPPAATSPGSSFIALLKQPVEETWQHELETHKHYQVWKCLLGAKNSHPVMCICQDYPIFFTKLSQSLNEVQQQVKMGRGSGTHHSQGDHRWSCPHNWVPLKCSADQSSFIAVSQQTFLYHETMP